MNELSPPGFKERLAEIPGLAHARRRLSCGLLGLILFLIYLRHGVMTRGFVDDAYIFLRYARNCLNGDWLAWNPGAGATDGVTSPLWLALCTVAMKTADWLHREPEALLKALLLGATVFWALCLYRAARAAWPGCSRLWPCLALGIIVVCDDGFDAAARTGMETLLASGLVALTILLLLRMERLALRRAPEGRLRRAAYASALAAFACVLTHPELAIFSVGAPALMFWKYWKRRQEIGEGRGERGEGRLETGEGRLETGDQRLAACAAMARSAGLSLILIVALGVGYAAAKYMIYGSLLPLPSYIKSGFWNAPYKDYDYESVLTLRGLPLEFLRHYALLIAALAAILVSREMRRATLWLWAPLVALILYWFTTLQIMGYEWRYYQPLIPMMTIMIFAAARQLRRQEGADEQGSGNEFRVPSSEFRVTNSESRVPNPESRITNPESPVTNPEPRVPKIMRGAKLKERRYLLAAVAMLLVAGYGWNFWRIYLWNQRHPLEGTRIVFREEWAAIRIIRRLESFPGMKIAATEIGYLGFRNPRSTIYDLSGLNDPEFCHGFNADALFKRRPDVICLVHFAYKGMVRDITNHPEFRAHFKPVFIPDGTLPERVDITHRIYCDERSDFYQALRSEKQ
ncbi:MAG: hypothetical protein NTX50_00170 [Candidatus Sumerlaeota bacterium]|nr:hypothetical protein [Candidatus Sumerlaeota bacterium]